MIDYKMFFKACTKGLLSEVENFLAPPSVNVNAVDHHGWTAVHMTAAIGRKDIAEYLIAKGADVNAKDIEEHTPLHEAALEGHKDVAEFLASNKGSWLQVLIRI